MHYYYYFSHSEGSRKRAQRLGGVEGENGKRHFFCRRMVWGVDRKHLVGVGVGIKKDQAL